MALSIYFACLETKDFASLEPIYRECKEHGARCFIIEDIQDIHKYKEIYSNIISDLYPIVVTACPETLKFFSFFRPRWSYLAIGCEHGISPFKAFTYGNALCEYDHYFAPTQLWRDRLVRLYGASGTQFHSGDFPRLDKLKKQVQDLRIEDLTSSFPPAWRGNLPSVPKRLVVLTWGIHPGVMTAFPDEPGIVYLLHPAQDRSLCNIPKHHASVVISSPEITHILVAGADVVFGDLSSLTLEIAYVRSDVYMVFDRRLYTDEHDLDNDLFDTSSPNYARIPETDIRIPENCIMRLNDIINVLRSGIIPVAFEPLHVGTDLLPPPKEPEAISYCTDGILNIMKKTEIMIESSHNDDYRIEIIDFLYNAYRSILKRDPDSGGMKAYMERLSKTSQRPIVAGLEVMLEMAHSEEGRKIARTYPLSWPRLESFPSRRHIGE